MKGQVRKNFVRAAWMAALFAILFSLTLTCAYAAVETETEDGIDRLPTSAIHWNDAIPAKIASVDAQTAPSFKLPASLQVIEDEAFEGTAIVNAVLPETLESIGERAFANIPSLRMVQMPSKIESIAKSAFADSRKVTIAAAAGSRARDFASENGLPYAPIATVTASAANAPTAAASQVKRTGMDVDTSRTDSRGDETPRWRSADEIHSEQYDQNIANCIVGRAPPACA